jgi:hypothetical protein
VILFDHRCHLEPCRALLAAQVITFWAGINACV